MNQGDTDNKIPYDMKCGTCEHIAADHWVSSKGIIYAVDCRECWKGSWVKANPCQEFVFDNLNYIEKLAERKKLI